MKGPRRLKGLVTPSAVAAVVVRPRLWGTALDVALRTALPRWWRRWPPHPGPDARYLAFRRRTMFGGEGGELDGEQLVGYLEWCRRIGRRPR